MSHLHDEIHSQPDIVAGLIASQSKHIKTIADTIRTYSPRYVLIAARGTSDNAARYAQYMFGIHLKLPVALAAPSIHTLYNTQPVVDGALVIGISQSGQSADVRQVLTDANEQGALTLAITNYDDSPLAELAQNHINLNAGEEKSVAATKTYTTELTVIAMLTQYLAQDEEAILRLNTLPQDISTTISSANDMAQWVQTYSYADRIAVIGRGYEYATAFEISLKIKELCYIVGEEYSEADFRHGPIAIISPRFPVIVVAPEGNTLPLMDDLLDQLQAKNASCIIFSNNQAVLAKSPHHIALPKNVPAWLMPICAVVPGQLFSYHLATAKGYDVDQPRGLNKVTITH